MYCIYIFIAYIDIYLRVYTYVCECGFVMYIIPMNFNNVLQFIVSNKSISANASVSILHTLNTPLNCTFAILMFITSLIS